MNPGIYNVRQARQNGQYYALEIEETVLNDYINEAITLLNAIIRKVNFWLTSTKKGSMAGSSIIRRFSTKRKSTEPILQKEMTGTKRLTQNRAFLNGDLLAVAYKLEGRKIYQKDVTRVIGQWEHEITAVVKHIKRGMNDLVDYRLGNTDKRALKVELDRVLVQINHAKDTCYKIGEADKLSDEPISKVVYPRGNGPTDPAVWNDYACTFQSGVLHVNAKKSTISGITWLSDDA